MAKQLSAVLAAAALISVSTFSYAGDEQSIYPFSVNESGPVLTAQQQQYQDNWAASRQQAQGVAGRSGFADDSRDKSGSYEVQTPSRGGPLDD